MGAATLPPLTAMSKKIDFKRCMGKWYVVRTIPNFIEKEGRTFNETETYDWDEAKQHMKATLEFSRAPGPAGPRSTMYQRGWVHNWDTQAEWRVAPKLGWFHLPIKLPYIIVDCADDYSHMTVGYPNRSYLWVMARVPHPPEEAVAGMLNAVESMGYDMSLVMKVPQDWGAAHTQALL